MVRAVLGLVRTHRSSFVTLARGFAIASAVACGDLKTANPDGTTSGEGADGGVSQQQTTPATSGPGDHGALPSGYCCTKDSECRNRHCVEVGGSKMCLDDCREQGTCVRRDLTTFTCDSENLGDDGLCQPPVGFQCIPAAKFKRGTREVGECCAWTGDGNAGEECDGNRCVSISTGGVDNPFVCSHWCETTKDCPSSTVCSPFNSCVPANMPYTCK